MANRELIDSPELRAARLAALKAGECIFNTTVTMACTGGWTDEDFCNIAIFNNPELTGFLPTARMINKGTL